MKVILSVDAVKYPLTGIGRYVFELATHLSKIPEVDPLRFFRGYRFENELPHAVNAQPSSLSGVRDYLKKNRLAVSLYSLVSAHKKKKFLSNYEDYVFHGPNYYLPDFNGPSVATIHDLSPFILTDCHPPERVRYMQAEIALTLKRASMLVTDSEYNRRELADYFGYPLEKIRAIPLASAGTFYPRTAAELQVLKEKYQLDPGNYCLYAGTIEPRKNIAGLLDAYEMLPEAIKRHWPLVLTGFEGWQSDDLHGRLQTLERKGWLRYLGFVDTEDLPLLFAGARLFVFPSLYEGFGLPVLEAMASGVPVVCSNASSLPEVVGDAAALCGAKDTDQLSRLIEEGLENQEWRIVASERGLTRAGQFSWQRCASETAKVYKEVSNSS